MKKNLFSLFLFIVLLVSQITPSFAESKTLYTAKDRWIESKDVRARLYSVKVDYDKLKTYVTIELVPKKNKGRLDYYTSIMTFLYFDGISGPPLEGFLHYDRGLEKIDIPPLYSPWLPFNPWGWNKVKKGQSYFYTMVFMGIIPPGASSISIIDQEDRPNYPSGYIFRNYSINNPHVGLSQYSTLSQIKNKINIDKNNDPYVGIYEDSESNSKIGIIKDEEGYLIINTIQRNQYERIGEKLFVLRKSSAPGIFKGNRFNFGKIDSKESLIFLFERGSMIIKNKNSERLFFKMYPDEITIEQNKNNSWTGSGFALKENFVVTNYHVIDNARSINIYGIRGDFNNPYKGEVVATDKNNDLAIIKINDNNFPGFGSIPYSISTKMADVGEEVYVLGYPMTATMGDEIKLTTGVISSRSGFQGDVSSYQISAPIQPGNSGGPIFDNIGNVIGIVNAKHQGAENVGYAIKTSYLKNLVESSFSNFILPANNTVEDLPLTGKVKEEKGFVYLIKCSN